MSEFLFLIILHNPGYTGLLGELTPVTRVEYVSVPVTASVTPDLCSSSAPLLLLNIAV